MPKISAFFKSFSFRNGVFIFAVLLATLLTVRVLMYEQTVAASYRGIKLLIDAHALEISEEEEQQQQRRYHAANAAGLVANILEDSNDRNLYLLYQHRDQLTGNIESWPTTAENLPLQSEYFELPVLINPHKTPRTLLVKIVRYHSGDRLLVGYDLERIMLLRQTLYRSLIENIVLSFAISLMMSWVIVAFLNRHLRRFNIACEHIRGGDLGYKIAIDHSGDEFDKLAQNINQMLAWNKTLIDTIAESSNAIAHDMRTPLSFLRLELMAISEDISLTASLKERILAQIERIDLLVEMFDHLINISKAESLSTTGLFEDFDIGLLLHDVVDFYLPMIADKQIECHLDIPARPINFRGDRQLMGQAFFNLMDNAYKYTHIGGDISISLNEQGNLQLREDKPAAIQIVFADNGPGIDEKIVDKVKNRFFRGDASRHSPGHGLGVSLVNAVATFHHGNLRLEPNHPGLKAVLNFPLHGDLK